MLLKTNGDKMSLYCLTTMFMKINKLRYPYHDVYERTGLSKKLRTPDSGHGSGTQNHRSVL
jgi:hypothetical protein